MGQGQQPERTRRQEFADLTLDELADQIAGPREGGPGTGTHNYNSAIAEVTRRQTVAQLEASRAQIAAADAQQEAAEATKKTARYTRRSARYILVSVIVLGALQLATVLLSAWSQWWPRAN